MPSRSLNAATDFTVVPVGEAEPSRHADQRQALVSNRCEEPADDVVDEWPRCSVLARFDEFREAHDLGAETAPVDEEEPRRGASGQSEVLAAPRMDEVLG